MNKINLKGDDLKKILFIPPDIQKLVSIYLILAEKGFIFEKFILYVDVLKQDFRVKFSDEIVQNQRKIQIIKVQNDEYGLPIKNFKYELNCTSYLTKLVDYLKKTDSISFQEIILQRKEFDDFIDVVIPMSFMQYVIWKSLDKEIIEIESKERINIGKKKQYQRKSKNEYKLIDCIKIYKKKNKNAGYTYTVDEFERRGYIRHYKNGKKVFVKPTTVKPKKKGKEKTKKEYKL